MQLRDGPGWFETCRLQQKLAFQPIEIRTRMRTIFCSDLVAAAIEADGVAEWNMEVERKIRRCRAGVPRRPMVMLAIEGLGELNGGRIRRVARTGRVVFCEQIGAEEGHCGRT